MQTVLGISLTWEIQKENNGRKGHSTFQMGNAKCQHAAVQCYCKQYPIVQDRLMARDRGSRVVPGQILAVIKKVTTAFQNTDRRKDQWKRDVGRR